MIIPPFNARSFAELSKRPEGEKLWLFLNNEHAKIKMMTASDHDRPALEAVAKDLINKFGDQFAKSYPHHDRFKQMAGAMTRQVMETAGYVLVCRGVPLLSGAPFSRASKYHKRDTV